MSIITNDESIDDLLASTAQYKIPEFQRNYSWGTKQLDAFWDDLVLAKNKNHFLSDKFVCGISWKSTNKDIGIIKSLNLIDLSPLLSIENVVFVSLQYGSTADEIEFVEKNIGIKIHTIDGLDIFNDIDGLVSLISLCDLVVTTSNITAHLTGAIGKKGMVLMPFSKGKIWYWHSGVGPSLWYPSLELVSQSQMNDWTDPINKCKEWVLGQL